MTKVVIFSGFLGAGKTTLIKLLCKLYRPTSGYITLNGQDIWSIPNEIYYRTIGAVFQDYRNGDMFSITIRPLEGSGLYTLVTLAQHYIDRYGANGDTYA